MIDTRQKAEQIRQLALSPNIIENLSSYETHMERHIGKKDVSLLNRVLSKSNKVVTATTFDDKKTAEECISQALIAKSQQIAEWVSNSQSDPNFEFTYETDKEIAGHGFTYNFNNHKIKEITSPSIYVTLKKDESIPVGFTLIRAFIDGYQGRSNVSFTGRDISDILHKTLEYQYAETDRERQFMEYQVDPGIESYTEYIGMQNNTDKNDQTEHLTTEAIRKFLNQPVPQKNTQKQTAQKNKRERPTFSLESFKQYVQNFESEPG